MNSTRQLAVRVNPPSLPAAYAAIPDVYDQAGLSFAQLWSIVWAYRYLSIAIGAIVLGSAAVILLLLPRTYEATATLMVNYEVNDPLNGKEFPIGLLGSYMATQTEIMRNPEVLLGVVDRLALTDNKEYRSGYNGAGDTLREYVVGQLGKRLSIYQGQFGSQLIYVTYAARTPAEATLVANTVADVYKEHEFARSNSPATERARRYAEQIEQLKAKVGQAQEDYTAFYRHNGLIDTGDRKADVDLALFSDLEQQLLVAQRARRAAESDSSGDHSVAGEVMNSPLVQSLKTQLAAQETQLAELLTTLGSRHPQVVERQTQIAASQRLLDREVSRYSSSADAGLRATQRLEQKLQRAVATQREKVFASTTLQDQAAKYRLELDSAQAVYKRALDGYDQVLFASVANYTNVSFVNRAIPPVKSSKPRVKLFLVLAGIAGGGLGLLVPLGYELANRRIRCRDDFERDNGIPVLVEFDSFASVRSNA